MACGQGMQVLRCMTRFLGLHDELLHDGVDIIGFNEKYYLFGMKSKANPKTFFLEITTFSGQRCIIWKQFQVMTFFFRVHLVSGMKIYTILELKIRISHRIFFLPLKYCMSFSLTTYKIPNCMTNFGMPIA